MGMMEGMVVCVCLVVDCGGCDVERKLPEIYRILLTLTQPHAAIQTPQNTKKKS